MKIKISAFEGYFVGDKSFVFKCFVFCLFLFFLSSFCSPVVNENIQNNHLPERKRRKRNSF